MKNKKNLVLSALGAVAFASIAVGTTFALFTSKGETNVQVNSGKINVSASLSDINVYSAVFDSETEYHEELQTATEVVAGLTHHLFSNGGYAAYDNNNSLFIIDRITPGDLVKFSFDVNSDSNVSFKYRFSYVAVDTDDDSSTSYLDLIKGMDTTIKVGEEEGVTYRGLAKYQTAWEVKSPEDALDDVEFTLSLPVEAGNEYQDKDAKILVAFEAVQANAYTDGDAEIILVEEDIASDPVIAVEDVPTVIEANSSTSDLSFEVTVPANAAYEGGTVDPDDKLTIEVTDLGKTEEVYTTETSLNFDLTLKVNDQPVNDFTEPLEVKIFVGQNLIISSVKHNGIKVSEYSYNATTGYITFETNSFSPFEVSFLSGVEVYNDEQLTEALKNGGKIGIKNDITVNQFLAVKKDTTIIGLGHTITVNDTRALRVQTSDVELNIADLHLLGGTGCQRGIQVDSGFVDVVINLDNVETRGFTHYAINLCLGTQVDMEINECEITGYAAINAYGSGNHINVSNSTLNGVNPYSGATNSFCTICLEGDTTMHTDEHSSDYIIKLVNCTITATSTGDQYECILGFNNNAINSSVEFINCSFEQGERCPFGYDVSGGYTNSIIINGQSLDYPRDVYFNID